LKTKYAGKAKAEAEAEAKGMSLLFCVRTLRRVALSQSFKTLKRHRHLTTESCTGRVLFLAEREEEGVECEVQEQHFYSAKIQKAILGPAIKLPPIPFKSLNHSEVRNGLLCHREDSQFYIYSADTGEVSTLPDVPTPEFPYEPESLDHYFGFDPLSNEPKVLLCQGVLAECGPMEERFWIFTRGSGSWNRIHPSPPHPLESFSEKDPVFANGTVHWIYDNREDHFDAYSYPRKYILAFDMVKEKFRKIKVPHPDYSNEELTTFGGRLALMEVCEHDEMRFWILENNDKWVKETIHFPFGWREYRDIVAFDNNTGEMLLESSSSDSFFFYNTKTGIFRTAELTGFPQWCQSGRYPSLYPVEVKFDD
jgi:F-box interacting protein